MDENQLVNRLQQGDEQAFSELVNSYSPRIFNLLISLVQSVADAEDLTQEVFIRIYQNIHAFQRKSKLSTWIYQITLSTGLEHIRKNKRKKRWALFVPLENVPATSHFDHPGVALEKKEDAAWLWKAIEALPENQKVAFVLHKIESHSHSEISAIMKVSVSSVESLIFRAKQNIKKYLEKNWQENAGKPKE